MEGNQMFVSAAEENKNQQTRLNKGQANAGTKHGRESLKQEFDMHENYGLCEIAKDSSRLENVFSTDIIESIQQLNEMEAVFGQQEASYDMYQVMEEYGENVFCDSKDTGKDQQEHLAEQRHEIPEHKELPKQFHAHKIHPTAQIPKLFSENAFFTSGGENKENKHTDTEYSVDRRKGRAGRKRQKRLPISYASMIIRAIEESPSGRMTLRDLYKWIQTNYPGHGFEGTAWQNSIRHNLSLNRCFKKIARGDHEHGKGGFWCINYDFLRKQEALKECGLKLEPSTTRKNSKKQDCQGARHGGSQELKKKSTDGLFHYIEDGDKEGQGFFQYNPDDIDRHFDGVIGESFLYPEMWDEKKTQKQKTKLNFVNYQW